MKIVQLKTFEDLLEAINQETRSFGFLAGGTDIMPSVNLGDFEKEVLFDLSPFDEILHYIKHTETYIEIGALTTLAEVADHEIIQEKIPQLTSAIKSIGSRQIRNMGTLAGNIANASPITDSAPVLLTSRARVNCVSLAGEREIEIGNFFLDYKLTALSKNEIIRSITIPINTDGGTYGFRKVAIRPDAVSAKVNLAYALDENKLFLAVGGVAVKPTRLYSLENNWRLAGNRADIETLLLKDVAPISDLRSTEKYRIRTLVNLIEELFLSFRV